MEGMQPNDGAEQAIRRYADLVYHLAFARTGSRADADDVFQEVFLRYVRRKPVFRDEEHRKAWLIRVTINCAKSFWNSAWIRKMQPLTEDIVCEMPEEQALYAALQRLPAKYREVIHLFYYEGYSTDEIARLLRRKSSTVRTQLTRARAMLRDFMEEDDDVSGTV